MTANVIPFTPRGELSAREHLDALVNLCRRSPVLDAENQFDTNCWVLGRLKGKRSLSRIHFSTLEAARHRSRQRVEHLPEPFLTFARAVLVYLQDRKPTGTQSARLSALRCLHHALTARGRGDRPTSVDSDVLDAAADMVVRNHAPSAAYNIGGQLENIAIAMRDAGVFELRATWIHSVPRPDFHGSRISVEAVRARNEKLPSSAALRGLAGVFRQASTPSDDIISCLTTLMMCAPERVNEVLRLRRNCLVEGDGRFAGHLGIRWPGSKGADDTTKWLPSSMTSVAREAIERLVKATTDAHKVAQWYSRNPTQLYLTEDTAHLRGREMITPKEASQILVGEGASPRTARNWLRLEGVKRKGRGFLFRDVEKAVLRLLPPTFPHVPGDPKLTCAEALAVVLRNGLHATSVTWRCMFYCIAQEDISARLGSRVRSGIPSLFERYGFTEDDGSPIVVRTHDFRHYLNTLAQHGGLSDTEIAIFSGRKSQSQNRAYDHRTSDEVQQPVRQALDAGFMGSIVVASERTLISRSEFKSIGATAAHTTDYGYCIHNFAAEPCQLHRDCLNCDEQICVKGESHKEANLRRRRDETAHLLLQAKTALSKEEYGADRWVEHQTRTLARIDEMLQVLADPNVHAGAIVRLNRNAAPLVVSTGERIPGLGFDGEPG